VIAGRYTLEAEIGRGGMGAVWRGRDEVLGRVVALKRIGVGPGGITPDALRAEREAKLAAKLNHANVVAVFDLVEETTDGQSQQWLVMEYVEGTNLSELVRDNGRLSPDQAAPILAHTASALAAAHGAGIVHRDVKPSNILVAPDGQVKLSDFGIARTASDPALTQTGLVTGSPAYLSPEVASGQAATPASDVWSWGATLFHALEGRPPYAIGDSLLGALYRIVHEEPPRPEAAGWLTPVLEGTMDRDPARRWSIESVQRFLEAGPAAATAAVPAGGLADVGVGRTARTRLFDDGSDAQGTQLLPAAGHAAAPARTPTSPTPVMPAGRPPRRRGWLVVAGAIVALVAAVVVAYAIGLGGGDDDDDPGTAGDASQGASPSATASQSGDEPTKDGMISFVEDYVAAAASDPAKAFAMLSSGFQEQSGGLKGYEGFWGKVTNAEVLSVSADPEALEVSYDYRYVRPPDGEREETVTLRLVFEDGAYLIDGEA
jgi:eukaryotic-like serine/threonine-protein kinase